MATLLTDKGEVAVPGARAEGGALWLTEADLEAATGWSRKPEGLCQGEICVPIPPGREAGLVRDGRVELGALWRYLGKPALHSADGETWALGESARDRGKAMRSLEAPDFALPDRHGRLHRLSEHRGKKVLLVSWASW